MIHFTYPTPTNDTAENRLKQTLFIVEGDAYHLWCEHSQDSLYPPWNVRENKRAYSARRWEQVGNGWGVCVGTAGQRPVMIDVQWYRIDGQWVMFYHGCSELVDHAMIDKWLAKHFTGTYGGGTRRARCDEGNFGHCLGAIDDANEPGYVKPGPLLTAAQVDKGFVGERFKVVKCEGTTHGREHSWCVCHLIDKTVTIGRRYDSPFVGTASYHLKGHKQRVLIAAKFAAEAHLSTKSYWGDTSGRAADRKRLREYRNEVVCRNL